MTERARQSDPTLLLGSTISNKYQVRRLIGQGGMGAVYEATNTQIGKRVALKFLNGDFAHDLEAAQRFQREAQAASAIESAHIVQIFDAGTTTGQVPFLVMELLHGEDLRAHLDREQKVTLSVARHIVLQVLRGLAGAHAARIVHRDLKPENIFLCQRDDDAMFVKLVDFGISKLAPDLAPKTLTGHGTVMGTAAYMSPEQAQAFPDVDGRTDLYSVGAILYEILAGQPPHDGRTYEAVLINLCTTDAPDVRELAPDVPEDVAQVIARALQRDRSLRFDSAESFYQTLAATGPRPSGPAARMRPPDGPNELSASAATSGQTHIRDLRRQTRKTWTAALVGLFLVLVLLGVLLAQRVSPTAEPSSAPDDGMKQTSQQGVSKDLPVVLPNARSEPQPATSPTGMASSEPGKPAKQKSRPAARPADKGVAGGLKLNTDGP